VPTVHVRDVDLYYETHGQGTPLLFVHGLGSSVRDWEGQVAHFSKRNHVITFDVRGHGRSGKPAGPYSVPQFAADAAALLNALGVASAHVVGISMGGMIAFQLAVDAPGRVRSLVIVNSGPELVARNLRQRLQIVQRHVILRMIGMRKLGELLSQRLLPKPEHAPLRQTFVERWAANDPRAYRDAFKALIGWSVAEHIGDIRCPTLVVAADNDYTPVSAKQAYVDRMPNAELVVIADARHAVTVEHPLEFNDVVEQFLSKQREAQGNGHRR